MVESKNTNIQQQAAASTSAAPTARKEIIHPASVDKVAEREIVHETERENLQRVHVQPVIEKQDVIERQHSVAPLQERRETLPSETRETFVAGSRDLEATRAGLAKPVATQRQTLPAEHMREQQTALAGERVQLEAERHVFPHVERTVEKPVEVLRERNVTEVIHEAPQVRTLPTKVIEQTGVAAAPAPAPAPMQMPAKPAVATTTTHKPAAMPMASSSAGLSGADAFAQLLLSKLRESDSPGEWRSECFFEGHKFYYGVDRHTGVIGALKEKVARQNAEDRATYSAFIKLDKHDPRYDAFKSRFSDDDGFVTKGHATREAALRALASQFYGQCSGFGLWSPGSSGLGASSLGRSGL